jgi:GTP-binding protein LepA
VLNKIDLPAADVPKVSAEIINLLGCSEDDILKISAKTGEGVLEVLDAVIDRVPQPEITDDDKTKALIFDSYYDDYRGVILYVRVFSGEIGRGDVIEMLATNASGQAIEVGSLSPVMTAADSLKAGQIGYIVTNLHTTREARVGDTVTTKKRHAEEQLPGYKLVKPFVYAGFFPVSNDEYQDLKDAIEKLSLSDSALQFEPENSPVLGFGVRIGFLGLLHLDIIRERLEREYDLDLVVTNPSTDYQVLLSSGEEVDIKSASNLPDVSRIKTIKEPWIKGEIIVPSQYIGGVIQLIISKRGMQNNLSYIDERALISFGEMVDALSIMAHRSEAPSLGREITKKLKEVIPRQNFQVALQAAIGGKFIAREDLSAYRKDVTTGLYGGDVSRKKKVLAKQAKGKKRMKRFGKVDIPSEAFMVMLKRD